MGIIKSEAWDGPLVAPFEPANRVFNDRGLVLLGFKIQLLRQVTTLALFLPSTINLAHRMGVRVGVEFVKITPC